MNEFLFLQSSFHYQFQLVNGNSSWGRDRHRDYVWPVPRENLSLEAGLKHLSVKKSRSEEVPLLLVSLLNVSPPPTSPQQPLSVPWGTGISSCLVCSRALSSILKA